MEAPPPPLLHPVQPPPPKEDHPRRRRSRSMTTTVSLPSTRRPVKKRRVKQPPPSTRTTKTDANGGGGSAPVLLLPPLQQREEEEGSVIPELIPERVTGNTHHHHHHHHHQHHPITTTTRTQWNLAPNDHWTSRRQRLDNDDDDDDTANEVPSPPPLIRSVAQVVVIRATNHHHNGSSNVHSHHLEPREDMSGGGSRSSRLSFLTPFRMPPPPYIPIGTLYDDKNVDMMDNNDPMMRMASRSVLPAMRSLGHETTTTTTTTKINYKNHNKLLPKQRVGIIGTKKNTTCLITAEDSDHDALYQRWTSTKTDGTKYPSVSSRSNATIPPSLMSGKMVSTKYGLAMLVVPASDVSIVEYTNAFMSSSTSTLVDTNHHHHRHAAHHLAAPCPPPPPSVYPPYAAARHHNTAPKTVTNRFKHWSKSEDDLLLYAMSQQVDGPPYMWQQIAQLYFSNTRNGNQVRASLSMGLTIDCGPTLTGIVPFSNKSKCKSRWKKIDPSLAKEAFTAAEDEIILKGEREGLSWPEIAHQLPGRNSDQIRSRFINAINPQRLKNVAWTVEETRILHQAQSELGNKWSVIASLLPGRSENDIKNHWHNQRLKMQRKLKSVAAHTQRRNTLINLRQNVFHSSDNLCPKNDWTTSNDDDDNDDDDDDDAKLPSNSVETTPM